MMPGAEVPGDRVWPVTDYGALGDDRTMNTGAIQDAIDACHLAGGGVVRFTPGIYLSGTLVLKDRVGLLLDAGAVLKGSPRREDYQVIRGMNAAGEPVFADHVSFLVFAENASHISINGQGEIHGNGEAFWLEDRYVFRGDIMKRAVGEWRPRALVCFLNCRFIKIRDVQMTHSPCYTLWPLGCDDVTIDAITIRNPLDGPNTDGIDLDCCRRVTVSNCVVEGGDDAICLKSDGTKLGEERPCEQVVVTNCVLRSRPACGVRIGYEGDSPIRDCLFSNLVIWGSHHGIDIVSILPDQEYPFTILHGTRVENIQFENLVMRDVWQPIHFWLGNEKPEQEPEVLLRNIRVSNVIVEGGGDSFIGSLIDQPVENIFLSDIHLGIGRNLPEDAGFYSHLWYITQNPYAIYFRNVDGLHVDGLSVDFTEAGGPWEHAVYCDSVQHAVLDRISVSSQGSVQPVSSIETINSSVKILNSVSE